MKTGFKIKEEDVILKFKKTSVSAAHAVNDS